MPASSPSSPSPSLSPRSSFLDRLLTAFLRWSRLRRTPGHPDPPLPPPPSPPNGTTTFLAPHQEQALRDAREQIDDADVRLAWMRDRADVLGRRPAPLPRRAQEP